MRTNRVIGICVGDADPQANLVAAYTETSLKAAVDVGFDYKKRKVDVAFASKDWPQIPVISNPKDIKAHVRLVVSQCASMTP